MGRERATRLAGLAIGLAALALRIAGLDRKSVWFDEAITYFDARSPWAQLLESMRADVHPPLSYVLYHLWPLLDAGDFWLRLPAALLGALAAVAAYAWARRIGSATQALLTGAFVALAPLQIDLAQEARMYGLLLLLTASSVWLFDRVLVCPTRRAAAAYALVCALVLYTHYYGAFLLSAEGLAALVCLRKPGARWLLGALVLAGLAFVPWLPVLAEQAGQIRGDYWIEAPTLSTLWVTFRELAAHTPPDEPFRLVLRVAYIAQAGLLVLGAAHAWREPRQRLAVVLGVVPIGLALAISLLVAPVFAVRYVSPVGLAFGFLLARGITALPRPGQIALGIVACLPVALSLGPLYTDPGYSRSDLRAAASTVQARKQPNDLVVHLGAFTATPFDYYRVDQPAVILETNDRSELCAALRGHGAGWLVTAYATQDDEAREAAERGIVGEYAGDLVQEPPLRFAGVSVFHLRPDC